MSDYVHGKQVHKTYGVTNTSLTRWAGQGKIRIRRTPGGHRLYHAGDVAALFGADEERQAAKVIYARVSSQHQKADLERQVARLCAAYPGFAVVKDIGSGLNWHRKGLQRLLERVLDRRVQTVVVAHRDRLGRFAVELLDFIFAACGCKLVVHGDAHEAAGKHQARRELADDLMAVANYFVASHNGRRSAANRRARKGKRKRQRLAGGTQEEKATESTESACNSARNSAHDHAEGPAVPNPAAAGEARRLDQHRPLDV